MFMYLTDYREYSLKDVIVNLEPELFRKVTGLSIGDFELLVSLNVFNSELMNDAVYKFKRYEDSSLEYTGIDTHRGTVVGGWDTAVDRKVLFAERGEPVREVKAKEEKPNVQEEVEVAAQEEKAAVQVEEKPEETSAAQAKWERIKVGDTVQHKSFGNGVVMSVDDRFIVVAFATKESRFLYPWVFEQGYLSVGKS